MNQGDADVVSNVSKLLLFGHSIHRYQLYKTFLNYLMYMHGFAGVEFLLIKQYFAYLDI